MLGTFTSSHNTWSGNKIHVKIKNHKSSLKNPVTHKNGMLFPLLDDSFNDVKKRKKERPPSPYLAREPTSSTL